MGLNGIILVDKPCDWTSHDVIGKLRGILHERRIGHSGTLDPMATGLLVVFVGRATRAVEFAEADSKEYIAGLRLGISTDTQDITGSTLKISNTVPPRTELEQALGAFKGEISQIPPMYSAIKVGGKKLYELARRGESVDRKPRRVTIDKLEVVDENDGDYIFDVVCPKGTYIRTLCNDIGDALGCGGCMSSLRRVKSGAFSIEQAHTIDEVQAAADNGKLDEVLIPVEKLFTAFHTLTVSDAADKKLRNGNIIKLDAPNGMYSVYSESGGFLLLGEVADNKHKTKKSFFEV